MAWLDDRVWSHPKFADLTPAAFRLYVYGVCYSSGFSTRGMLTEGVLRTIGCNPRLRKQLLSAGLWNADPCGVTIHDWDEHNGKRDDRRARDRERKREARALERQRPQDSPQDSPLDVPQDSPQERPGERPQERRVLKEVKEVTEVQNQADRGLDNGPLRDDPNMSAFDWDHILKPIPD